MQPRPRLEARAAELGFTFKDAGGQPYWDEGACYLFSLAEVEGALEEPTNGLARLCLDVAGKLVHDDASPASMRS